jgi:hypothetical protein
MLGVAGWPAALQRVVLILVVVVLPVIVLVLVVVVALLAVALGGAPLDPIHGALRRALRLHHQGQDPDHGQTHHQPDQPAPGPPLGDGPGEGIEVRAVQGRPPSPT